MEELALVLLQTTLTKKQKGKVRWRSKWAVQDVVAAYFAAIWLLHGFRRDVDGIEAKRFDEQQAKHL